MSDRELNDLRAKIADDQTAAAMAVTPIGERLPSYIDVVAGAAHCIDPKALPAGVQDSARRLLSAWAEKSNVTPFEERTDKPV